jgi:DsbC/DsbD-like thiol-disulfide interchange protein
MVRLIAGFVIVALALVARSEAGDSKIPKSHPKVKATATAGKIDAAGKQTVTVILDIDKGSWMLANPPNHNNDFLDGEQVTVKIVAKEKAKFSVKYPVGKTRQDNTERYDIYEGVVKIEANVVRSKGDTSPLEVSIYLHTFNGRV